MKELMTFQSVEGEVRYRKTRKKGIWMGITYKKDVEEFCDNYNKSLHLITNNCYTFAWKLIHYLKI